MHEAPKPDVHPPDTLVRLTGGASTPITDGLVREIASKAFADPRTVVRYLLNAPLRPLVRARIASALEQLTGPRTTA
jgi:hypothetical protein